MSEEIIRLAAKGDGVTASGQHLRGALPGDVLDDGKIVQCGPHHVAPPCRHFGTCGGCQLQHADEVVLADFVRDRVVNAAKGQDIAIGELLPEHLSPPHSRRRATLHAMRTHKAAVLGYREAGSHRIVDLAQCHVIDPALAALVAPLRAFIGAHGPSKGALDAQMSLCDQGIDLSLTNFPLEGLAATEGVLDFARDHGLARVTIDQGYGGETVWEPHPATITLSGVPVRFCKQRPMPKREWWLTRRNGLAMRVWSPTCLRVLALSLLPCARGVRCWQRRPSRRRIWPARRLRAGQAAPFTRFTATCSATPCRQQS